MEISDFENLKDGDILFHYIKYKQRLFINNEKSKHLMINKNDIMFIKDIYKRNMIKNQVIFDINNVITIFTNLSMINMIIKISIVLNSIKNLKMSIHLTH